MALGYEGIARMEVQVAPLPGDTVFLCTGAAVPRSTNRIDSSAGYGGLIGDAGGGDYSEMGVGAPYEFDWEIFDGSIDFDLHKDLWEEQVNPWIFNRQTEAKIKINPRFGDLQQFDQCFWNSISLNASDGALVSGSIGFVAVERNSYSYAQADYVDDVRGYIDSSGSGGLNIYPAEMPTPLQGDLCTSGEFGTPVPHWVTRLFMSNVPAGGSDFVDFTTWGLTLNQEVVKFFICEGNVDPQEPKFLAVGPMTADFNCEYIYVGGTAQFDAPDTIDQADIHLFGTSASLRMSRMKLDSVSEDIPGQEGPVPVAAAYRVYELDKVI